MKGGKPFIFFTGFAGFKERLISRFLCYFLSRAAKPPRKMMLAFAGVLCRLAAFRVSKILF